MDGAPNGDNIMKHVLFIVPEARMDAARDLKNAFALVAGVPVLALGPTQWRDGQGRAYSVAAGVLEPAWIEQVRQTKGSAFTAPEAQAAPDLEEILLIETDTPLHVLDAMGLALLDEAP